VQVAPFISDVRFHHPRAIVPPCKLDGLIDTLERFPRLRFNLINVNARTAIVKDILGLKRAKNFFIDIAWADGVACIDDMCKLYGLSAVVFGTNAPLMYPLSVIYKMLEVDLSSDQKNSIIRGNALRFLGKTKR